MSKRINVPLLLFLLLFLNVKLIVKIAAIFLVYLLQPDFRFGLRRRQSRLPLFYLLIAVIGIFDWLVYRKFQSFNYNLAFVNGILYWTLALLAIHQIKLFVEKTDTPMLHRTLTIFFVINALISIGALLLIILEIKHLNPYLYQGNFQKYFLNTGDYIKGATFDVSITNAVIASIGVIYFLLRSNLRMLFLNMLVLLLTTSNTIILLLFGVSAVMLFYKTTAGQKSAVVCCLMLTVVFMVKISPQNMHYVDKLYQKVVFNRNISFDTAYVKQPRITDIPDSLLSPGLRKQKIAQLYIDALSLKLADEKKHPVEAPVYATAAYTLPVDSIHTATFQPRSDTDDTQRNLQSFMRGHHLQASFNDNKVIPGKVLSLQETFSFLVRHPALLFTGAGMGNFSSKLAFRTTALGVAGKYPQNLTYISPWFLNNHLHIYLNFFSQKRGWHSIVHAPDSVYNQLPGEYGVAGIAVFLIFYVGYFVRYRQQLSYGLPLLILLLLVFFTGYWFEQLSVVVLFELLLFIDIKEHLHLTPQSI